ncbi:ABC transporter ATPase [Clostridium botulinum]|uniref:Acb2/Tad1 domain-containing protein n=1 Tax=Clostridium sp. ZBS12 TaxID=2949972 RepID=UPI0004FFCA3E|nr:hypothetical protein [Clostridium sp. ZBS12]KFX56156.1 ABC transporter ATPase [Clostridium botulinum]MBY6804362.1 ABC transporter ATPase [Clostridium botulinum]MBY6813325.1 ABC transporter ATPase [Clostridium botulinum]MBY6821941.1 ABC transporter ATPase [Clostridium botulinum]NFJ49931.1 ABC transporter ATPase [Clostridium botulinum]
MKELSTIQKREKLNTVNIKGEVGPGGAYHKYNIISNDNGILLGSVQFQMGPRNETNSIAGVIDSDLLEIVRDRLQCFQTGPFSSRENAIALTHIEEALMWMNRRVEDRIERNVLGRNEK